METLPVQRWRNYCNIITILSQTFGPNGASVSGKYPVNELEDKHSLSFKIISRRKDSHQFDDMSNSVSVLDLTFKARSRWATATATANYYMNGLCGIQWGVFALGGGNGNGKTVVTEIVAE